ncbi:MAG: TonB-dependent receptor [Glycocaulis sp.]
MRTTALTTTAIIALAMAAPAQAQDQGETVARSGPQLEVITITARKTEENLQEVPIAVSAYTAAEIQRRGIRNAQDLSSITPGLNVEQDQGRRFDRPVIRGQSNVLGVPNAASFIDGVYIPDSLFATELAFVDQIEVIKGPQSALYGRQTFSGAISYTTREPSDVFEGQLRVTAAEHDEYNFLGSISGPIVDGVLSGQLALNYYTYGGEYRNNAVGDPSFGRTIGQEETRGISGGLRFTPSDNLSFTLRATYAENDDGHEVMVLQRASNNNCFLSTASRYYCGAINVGPEDITLNLDAVGGGGVSRETTRISLISEYDFENGFTLTSISGYNNSYESRKADLDFLPIAALGGSLHVDDRIDIESFSQELRIASPVDRRFSWLAGVYYYNGDTWNGRYRFATDALQDNGVVGVTNYAAFALARFDFTDRLTGTAEVRIAEEELTLTGSAANFDLSATYRSTNPRFTLAYQANDFTMLYASAARGNKPGGFNADVRLAPDQLSYGEESAWNYEIGIKSDLFDQRVRLNAAAFFIDWTNQQLTQSTVVAVGGTAPFIRNVGELEVRGFEVEGEFQVTDNWRLRGTYSYAESEYTNAFDPDHNTLTGNGDITGNTAPNAPRTQFSVGTHIWWPMFNDSRGFFDATYAYRGRKFAQVSNLAWVDARDVANAQLGWELNQHRVILFGRNLFDNIEPLGVTRYVDFGDSNRRGFLGTLPRGRQFGITYEMTF